MANALGGVLLAGMAPIFMLALIGLLTSVQIFAWQPVIVPIQFDGKRLPPSSQATLVSGDDNGAFVSGYTNLTTGPGQYFISHFDQNGRLQWSRPFGAPGDMIRSMSAGVGAVYVLGTTSSTWVLAQYDSNGNQLWSRSLNLAYGYISYTNGNAYVVGNGSMVVFNSQGTVVRTLAGLNFDGTVMGASATISGFYVLTTNVLEKLSLDGSKLWTAPLAGCSAYGPADAQSSLTVTSGMEFVDYSSCLIEYDSSAKMIWNYAITCVDQSYPQQSWISTDSASVYAVTSSDNGRNCLTKYDYSGNVISGFYLSGDWRIHGISTGGGATYVAGTSGSLMSPMVLLARLDFSHALILLGLRPPLSYLLIVGVLGLICLGIFRYRRRRRPHLRGRWRKTVDSRDPLTDFRSTRR
ncbi:hypothetical protein J2P12_02700 [Candidatus Bathyarchaeota archaeon]|nr:hypothetical protein [Candidatus Bathyarchaeota archaeon]